MRKADLLTTATSSRPLPKPWEFHLKSTPSAVFCDCPGTKISAKSESAHIFYLLAVQNKRHEIQHKEKEASFLRLLSMQEKRLELFYNSPKIQQNKYFVCLLLFTLLCLHNILEHLIKFFIDFFFSFKSIIIRLKRCFKVNMTRDPAYRI